MPDIIDDSVGPILKDPAVLVQEFLDTEKLILNVKISDPIKVDDGSIILKPIITVSRKQGV